MNKLSRIVIISVLYALSCSTWAESTTTYLHNDGLGSPVATSNELGDTLWQSLNYQPYGKRVHDAAAVDRIGYTGKLEDSETGLGYMNARYYDVETGRFISVDPVTFTDGGVAFFNRYVYANNNPYAYTDPTGESPFLWLGQIARSAFNLPMKTINGVRYAASRARQIRSEHSYARAILKEASTTLTTRGNKQVVETRMTQWMGERLFQASTRQGDKNLLVKEVSHNTFKHLPVLEKSLKESFQQLGATKHVVFPSQEFGGIALGSMLKLPRYQRQLRRTLIRTGLKGDIKVTKNAIILR